MERAPAGEFAEIALLLRTTRAGPTLGVYVRAQAFIGQKFDEES